MLTFAEFMNPSIVNFSQKPLGYPNLFYEILKGLFGYTPEFKKHMSVYSGS